VLHPLLIWDFLFSLSLPTQKSTFSFRKLLKSFPPSLPPLFFLVAWPDPILSPPQRYHYYANLECASLIIYESPLAFGTSADAFGPRFQDISLTPPNCPPLPCESAFCQTPSAPSSVRSSFFFPPFCSFESTPPVFLWTTGSTPLKLYLNNFCPVYIKCDFSSTPPKPRGVVRQQLKPMKFVSFSTIRRKPPSFLFCFGAFSISLRLPFSPSTIPAI